MLVRLLTHEDRALAHPNPSPVRVFGNDMWDVFELRSQLGTSPPTCTSGSSPATAKAHSRRGGGIPASRVGRYPPLQCGDRPDAPAAADALERLGAGHLAKRWLDELSSGEARRVLLARALVTSPRALVLDEPTTGLDLVARHDFMERVRQIAREGTTLILITHHIDEIVPEIERVILLRQGRIAADGTKRSVLTAEHLSDVFNASIRLEESDGYYYAHPAAQKK